MSILKASSGFGSEAKTAHSSYEGYWPFLDGAGATALADKSGAGAALPVKAGPDASFWGTAGRGSFIVANDCFGEADSSLYDIGVASTNFIASFRFNCTADVAQSVIFGKRDQVSGDGIRVRIGTTGNIAIDWTLVGGGTVTKAITTDVCDGVNHHVIITCDKTGLMELFLDGVRGDNSFVAGVDMTAAGLSGDASVSGGDFIIGAEGLIDGTTNTPLSGLGGTQQFWDFHLLFPTAIPTGTDFDSLVNYFYKNQYSLFPSDNTLI